MLKFSHFLLVFLTCCIPNEKQGNNKSTHLSTTVEIGYAETVSLDPEELYLTFLDVLGDSRCPKDVTCIHAGEATILIEVSKRDGTVSNIELTALNQNSAKAIFKEYRISLEKLKPWPVSTQTIEPKDYIAVLRIEERADNQQR